MVTKYNLGLQGHLQILEAQSRSIHLRPEDGKGFLEVAAEADKAGGERGKEKLGRGEGGRERGGRGRAGRKERREEAIAKERPGSKWLILGQIRGRHNQGYERGWRRLMSEEGLEQAKGRPHKGLAWACGELGA